MSEYFRAFAQAMDLADRWALVAANDGANRAFTYALSGVEMTDLFKTLTEEGYDIGSLEKPLYAMRQDINSRLKYENALDDLPVLPLIESISASSIPNLLGPPPSLRRISYENPVEIIIGGIAFGLWGVVSVFRLVRSWSSRRRTERAAASIAEAEARIAMKRADIVEYLADEVKAGRLQIAPADLVKLVQQADLEALSKLAAADVTLELPSAIGHLVGGNDEAG